MTRAALHATRTPVAQADAGRVLAKALTRAARALDLSQREVARLLGVSEATASRLVRGRALDPESKPGELAVLFLRIFRSLDALVGGNEASARAWLHGPNLHLNGTPVVMIQTALGVVLVSEYLDAMRGRL